MAKRGQIIKARSNHNITIIKNEVLQDPELSWKEKGLLSYLLSLPDDWTIYLSELPNHSDDGYHATRAAFKGLQEKGYIFSTKHLNNKGQFDGYSHIVYSEKRDMKEIHPHCENPITVPPKTASSSSGNYELQNKHIQNKHIQNKHLQDKTEFLKFITSKGKTEKYATELYDRMSATNFTTANDEPIKNLERYLLTILRNEADIGNQESLDQELERYRLKVKMYNGHYLDPEVAKGVLHNTDDKSPRYKTIHRYLELLELTKSK